VLGDPNLHGDQYYYLFFLLGTSVHSLGKYLEEYSRSECEMFVIREASTRWSRFQHSRRCLDSPFADTPTVTAGVGQKEKDAANLNVQHWDIVSSSSFSVRYLMPAVHVLPAWFG
jgi:hypothetical protein